MGEPRFQMVCVDRSNLCHILLSPEVPLLFGHLSLRSPTAIGISGVSRDHIPHCSEFGMWPISSVG